MKKKLMLLLAAAGCLVSSLSYGQISLTTPNSSYSDNFDGMGATGTVYPTGWTGIRFAGSGTANATLTPGVTDGGTGTIAGNTYNTGTTSASDRALGTLASGSTSPAFGTSFTNNTGSVIADFSLTGNSEQWKAGTSNTANEVIIFEYSTNATSLFTGTWTAVSSLNLVEILTTTTVSAPVDGNNVANRIAVSGSINAINLGVGNTIWIRWRDADNAGSDGIYALDDFQLSYINSSSSTVAVAAAGNGAEAPSPTNGSFTITFSPATTGTTDIDYAYTGTGTFGTDYTVSYSAGTPNTATSTGTLSVPSGVTSVTVTITPVDDATVEGTETVIAGLSNATAGYSITTASATINITDDDTAPTVSVAAGTNPAEPATNGTFALSLSAPAPVGGVTIGYSFTGTATLNSDYSDALSGTITIPQGQSAGTITTTTIDDAITEASETIIITLNTANASYVIATASATINLADDGDITPIPFTGTYTQDFNTLATSGTVNTTPSGWTFAETGTNANATYTANDGGANGGNTYSYGTGTNTDRAFGTLLSGSLTSRIGAKFINNTGATLSSLTIQYTGEKWRLGTLNRTDELRFEYSTDATTLTNGTWTTAAGISYLVPGQSGTTGALDGNQAANRQTILSTLSGLSIPNGATFLFRWVDADASGADDGLAVDDFTLSLGCTAPTNQPTSISLTPALTAISGSFAAAVAGSTPADEYLVVISASSSLSASPSSGTAYAIDDAIGNGRVIAITNATSFTATGLTPSTLYYFFIFSNSLPTNCYNITNPLTGNTSTLSPPPCTAPTPQASGLSASPITGTSINLNYTRGGGDNILIVARVGSPVNSNPINSLSYTVGNQIGTDNFVIYNGTASTFSHTSLTPNTAYYYALYEYNSADFCYNATALTGNFNTACVNPVNVTALNGTAGNAIATINWALPNAGCYDELIVVASNASVPGVGSDYPNPANTVYGGPNQVVYRGTGTNVVVTGLTNGTTYYFKVFTRLGAIYSSGIQTIVTPFDPASGYQYLFGNLHAHSSYSDGNKDDLSKTPIDDYTYARDALCMDFLGISEHNHSGAGMVLSDYVLGYNQANAIDGVVGGVNGNSIVAMYGMEWGVISGGGHVITYGFDNQLIGWEAGNYDIFVAKNDYATLFNTINAQPGAFGTLAHPEPTHFGNIANTTYDAGKDNAIVGVAVESGPAFSTNKTFPYNDFPTQLGFLSYYKTMLARGYHLGASIDQDNHNMTFGTANASRLVVLTAAKNRAEVMNAMRSMRFYASNDCNARIDYKLNTQVMGSSVTAAGVPAIIFSVTDLDAEDAASIELWGGEVGSSVPSAPIKSYTAVNSFTFNSSDVENTQPDLTTYYYYIIVTQVDGNKIVSSPIWFTRNNSTLPVSLISFNAVYNAFDNSVVLKWSTAQEINSKHFVLQRSIDGGITYQPIGTVAAAGNTASVQNYQFTDFHPQKGKNLYRLIQVDNDDTFEYSRIVSVTTAADKDVAYFSVYPNPVANGKTYIYATQTTVNAKASVELYDAAGKTVKINQVTIAGNAPVPYDVSGLKAGIYFVKIISNGTVTNQKLIIK